MATTRGIPRPWLRLSTTLAPVLLPVSLALFYSGCSTTVDIDARDSVRFANLEGSIPINDDGSMRLRLRGASASGDFDQTLDADERVDFDDERIPGPAEIQGDVDIDNYSLALGWDRRYQDGASGTWRSAYYVGVQQTEFDLELESDDRQIADSDSSTAIYFQYLLDYAVTDNFDIGFGGAFSLDSNVSASSELDLRFEYAFYRQLRLVGGYRWYDFHYEPDSSDSDLEVDFRGPFLGLNLAF